MKRLLFLAVSAVFISSFFTVALVYRYNADFTTLAQSDTVKNTNCPNNNKNGENSNSRNKSEADERCDFSKYKTLRVHSLKIDSLPQPEYPSEAKEKNLEGCVPVKILVDSKGNVAESCAMEKDESSEICSDRISDSFFERLSEEAAAKAKFDVRHLSLGSKKYYEMTIVYRFVSSK